ncbi:hypothetical protein BU25DRAFT_474988 [Macroventuria anomochaeta]|uniref:Uncharacterized protein n=1 Tax=Macroventuria anomochaeta TaxID=301207 RepID=A0ACB6SCB7_9PLEO|nr:uncharacterized protein BU25DRAFT_474988 [Macroventuria anomochaeta]KAF2631925.1 hypothetical protein BU25DRAFT_474988 [Macroventuria anomochaeta]
MRKRFIPQNLGHLTSGSRSRDEHCAGLRVHGQALDRWTYGSVVFHVYASALPSVLLMSSGSTGNGTFHSRFRLHDMVGRACTRKCSKFCRSRSFFITSVGYFGLGPHIMQDGDICCVLYGVHVPMKLREASRGEFRLIGEAYIESIIFEAEPDRNEEREVVLI